MKTSGSIERSDCDLTGDVIMWFAANFSYTTACAPTAAAGDTLNQI